MTVHFNSISVSPTPALPKTEEGRKAKGLYRNFLKRSLDILLILITLPLTLPIVAVMALLVMRDGSSPFYWQDRVGRNGRTFRLMKIRTMVPDAKGMLAAHLATDADAREEWETTQKLKCDPRITRIGVVLRKTSLDELPQLWNVLRGDMALVGPRPMMPEQRRLYPGSAYYAMRPGITGPWQVSDRNEGTFAGRAKFDADYYKNLSFATDLSILLRTVAVVVRGTGY